MRKLDMTLQEGPEWYWQQIFCVVIVNEIDDS